MKTEILLELKKLLKNKSVIPLLGIAPQPGASLQALAVCGQDLCFSTLMIIFMEWSLKPNYSVGKVFIL